jgi:hypothetical protein
MIRSPENEALKNIPDGAWTLIEETDTYRRYACKVDDRRTAYKTEHLGDEEIIALNKQEYDDSYGKRFGDGRVVARIPLNVYYNPQYQIVQKMIEGDREHMSWVLNQEWFRPYRNFRGRI